MEIMESAVWGFIGTIIGSGVSICTTRLNNKNSFNLLAEGKKIERQEKANQFQFDNYLKIQESLLNLIMMVGIAHIEFKNNRNIVDSTFNKESSAHILNLVNCMERVNNDSVRESLKNLLGAISDTVLSPENFKSDKYMERVNVQYKNLREIMGNEFRKVNSLS